MKFVLLQLLLASFAAVHAQSTCTPYRLVWVSCTGSGNEMDFVGTAVLSSLRAKLNGPDVKGSFVRYPANTPRDLSSEKGAKQLAIDMTTYASQCPNQTFVVGGYSQGVIVLHRASLPLHIIKRIAAVTVFGDPVFSSSYYPTCKTQRVVATCGISDSWCNDPEKGPNKEGGVKNLLGPGNHQDYHSKEADAAVDAIIGSIKNPFAAGTRCSPPPQPSIEFDHHLNYD
jgi:hypothetical protein